MRLTCPNCGAQYEIPDDVIPEAGRDVQCSNCGDTWFQEHPDHPAETPPEPAGFGSDQDRDDDPDMDEDAAVAASTEDDGTDEDSADDDASVPASSDAAARRRLDPDVASVLREEAEREQRARAREAGALESQPDLGLDDSSDAADQRSREARARMARLRGDSGTDTDHDTDPRPDAQDSADTPEIDPASRRGLLPDIEEINSSLRNDDSGDAGAMSQEDIYPETAGARSGDGGFRRGFVLIVVIAAILTAIYLFAPQIGAAVPALADVLSEYVAVVNEARAWLDGQIAGLMAMLDGMASESGGTPDVVTPTGDATVTDS